MTNSPKPQTGQIFFFPLRKLSSPYEETGYLGACQVLRIDKEGAIIAGIDWVGNEIPNLVLVLDTHVLKLHDTTVDNQPAIYWREKKAAPDNFSLIGEASPRIRHSS